MKYKNIFLTIFSLAAASCSQDVAIQHNAPAVTNPIMVHGWKVGCEISNETHQRICSVGRVKGGLDDWEDRSSLSIIRVEQRSDGPAVRFSRNSSPNTPGQVMIDDNPIISYEGRYMNVEKSKVLIEQMLHGNNGHVVTYDMRNHAYTFGFSLSGFKQAYAKMQELYADGQTINR